jgi:hypothetical protein
VEILAAAVVLLQFLQFILHHLRFRRSHWLLQWGAWGAYYVPAAVLARCGLVRRWAVGHHGSLQPRRR